MEAWAPLNGRTEQIPAIGLCSLCYKCARKIKTTVISLIRFILNSRFHNVVGTSLISTAFGWLKSSLSYLGYLLESVLWFVLMVYIMVNVNVSHFILILLMEKKSSLNQIVRRHIFFSPRELSLNIITLTH